MGSAPDVTASEYALKPAGDLVDTPSVGESGRTPKTTGDYDQMMRSQALLSRGQERELGRVISEAHTQVVTALAPIPVACATLVELVVEAERGQRPSTDLFLTPFTVDLEPHSASPLIRRRSEGEKMRWRAAGKQLAARYENWVQAANAAARDEALQAMHTGFQSTAFGWVMLSKVLERIVAGATAFYPTCGDVVCSDGDSRLSVEARVVEARAAYARYQRARETLLNANLRLVHQHAYRFRDNGLDPDDLVQEALLGLLRAVDRFDFSLGFKFSTYAVSWIRQATALAIANHSRTVRVPAYVHERALKVRRTRAELSREMGRAPTLAELAQRCVLASEQVRTSLENAHPLTWLRSASCPSGWRQPVDANSMLKPLLGYGVVIPSRAAKRLRGLPSASEPGGCHTSTNLEFHGRIPREGYILSTEHLARFKIGAAARAVGISVHTLRKWEERHGAVTPHRTPGGGRIYTAADIERLELIKQLAEGGSPLATLAKAPTEELREALENRAVRGVSMDGEPARPVRMVAIGSSLSPALAAHAVRTHPLLKTLDCAASVAELAPSLADIGVDVLVVDLPTVSTDSSDEVLEIAGDLRAGAVVLVYGFASQAQVLDLQAAGIVTLRSPVSPPTLARTVVELGRHAMAAKKIQADSPAAPSDIEPPRLSRELLSNVLGTNPGTRCGCPHHVADILLNLRNFEDYCSQCEDQNPQDAVLHRYLARSTARARALFEAAMERVAEAEGLSLD